MPPLQSKLPRRHAQRKTLRQNHARTPLDLPDLQNLQQHTSILKIKERSSDHSESDSTCDSVFSHDHGSEASSETSDDSDSDNDSRNNDFNGSASEGEQCERLRADFVAQGPILANHSDITKEQMRIEELKWKLYCKRTRKADPVAALKSAIAADFKTFLSWRRKRSRIKKESTMFTYWHITSMNYQKTAQRYMDEGILYDMRNWIPTLGLDKSEGEKSALYIEDLCVLQNGLWVRDQVVYHHERLRVQTSPIIVVAGCTSTRPAALVGKIALLYEDIEFQVFPPYREGGRPAVRLIINLKNIKRSGGKKKPKIFTFRDDEGIENCPIIFFMALAIADKAFQNNFTSLRQIYELVVPIEKTDRIRLKWNKVWAKRAVFRDVEHTIAGVCISETKSLRYQKHRHIFIGLGRTCRFRKRLQWYDLRRGSGKGLNEELTPEERRHTMGNSGDVYERCYMPSFVDADCQAIYLGTTRREDVIRAVGRLERHNDAPDKLNETQKEEIRNHPSIIKKVQARNEYANIIKQNGYSTIKAATGTSWHKEHSKAQRKINNKKSKLQTKLLEKSINDFYETVHVDEVDRQMQGILPRNEVLTPSGIEYQLEERATVARLLFQPIDDLDEDQLFDVRVQLVDALVELCHLQEAPRKFKTQPQATDKINSNISDKIIHEEEGIEFVRGDQRMQTVNEGSDDTLRCPFCKQGPFSRQDSLGRHVRVQHLGRRAESDGFFCPYEGCRDYLGSAQHFLSHTARQHGVCL